MNLTSKQRAYLGSEASTMNAIFQIGKASLTPELINGLDGENCFMGFFAKTSNNGFSNTPG